MFMSSQLEQLVIEKDGRIRSVAQTIYSLPTPILIGGREQKAVFLWFQPEQSSAFEFEEGRHVCELAVYQGPKLLAERSFEIQLASEIARGLKVDMEPSRIPCQAVGMS